MYLLQSWTSTDYPFVDYSSRSIVQPREHSQILWNCNESGSGRIQYLHLIHSSNVIRRTFLLNTAHKEPSDILFASRSDQVYGRHQDNIYSTYFVDVGKRENYAYGLAKGLKYLEHRFVSYEVVIEEIWHLFEILHRNIAIDNIYVDGKVNDEWKMEWVSKQ